MNEQMNDKQTQEQSDVIGEDSTKVVQTNDEPKSVKTSGIDKWIDIGKFVLASAVVAMAVTYPGLYMIKKSQTKVGVVDVQALLVEHEQKVTKQLYANQGLYQNGDTASLNNGAIEQQTKQFIQKMEASIDEINQNCDCVLINKAALLTQSGNVIDYTQKVREAIEK